MEAAVYVNSPADVKSRGTKTNTCPSGGSKVITVVAVVFGLLCVLQVALNVSLRLGGGGETPSSSANCSRPMTDEDVCTLILEVEQLRRQWEEALGSGSGLEEGWLLWENMQLRQEKKQLLIQKTQLAQDKNRLRREKVSLAQQKNLLLLKSQVLAEEKVQLEARNTRLAQELEECKHKQQ